MAKVFFVEDNDAIREAVTSYLKLDDHKVYDFAKLSGVAEAVNMQQPDIIILDVMLSDGNGFQFAKHLREKNKIPILFLTARTSESDRITGFEVGGDDYLIKPFSPRELCLRVRAILKRAGRGQSGETAARSWKLAGDTLVLDSRAFRVSVNNRKLNLTTAEYKILDHLALHTGLVFSRERLLGECLDYTAEGSERTIDTHIKNIRSKLGNAGWIETIRGIGYRFSGTAL